MTTIRNTPARNIKGLIRNGVATATSSSYARSGVALVSATTFANIANFIFHLVQTRLLAPDRYGEMSALLNVVVVLTLPLGAIEAAMVQMVATHMDRQGSVGLRNTLRWWVPVAVVSMLIVAGVSPIIGKELRIKSTWTVMLIALWLGPAMLASVFQGTLIGERRIKPVVITQFTNGIARLSVGVVLAAVGFGVAGAFAGTVASAFAMCVVLYVGVAPQIRSRAPGPRVKTADVLRSAFSIGGITVMISLDTWMARHFLSGSQAGIYAAAATLGKIPLFLPGAVYLVVFPRIASEHGRGAKAQRHLIQGLICVTILSFLGAAFLIALPGPLISIFAGDKYGAAAHPLVLLAIAYAASAISTTIVYFLMARRSRLALSGWGGSVLAVVLIAISHATTMAIARDMIIANLVILAFLIVVTLAQLASDRSHSGSVDATGATDMTLPSVPLGKPSDRPRRIAVGCGLVAVVAVVPLGLTNYSYVTGAFADLAVFALLVAIVSGAVHAWRLARYHRLQVLASAGTVVAGTGTRVRSRWLSDGPSSSSKWWALLVCACAVAAVSTWYHAGTVVAAGDLVPPNGTAWISHVFDAWSWTGINLGGPNTDQVLLPWAVVLLVVEHLGGSAAMAEQIWMSILLAVSAVATFGMLRLLRVAPVAACIGALLYVFSACTMAMIGYSPVFMAAQTALPLISCIVIAVATNRMRMAMGVVLLACTAPLDGYVYTNPPSVLLIAFGVVAAIACVSVLCGREALVRCGRFLLVGLPVLVLVCAYWLVPALIASRTAATSEWAPVSTWTWTEIRDTVANALWLNTVWGWHYVSISPVAPAYRHMPLLLLKYLPAMAALAAVPLVFRRGSRRPDFRPLVVVAAAVALFFILLSNGTRAPGNVIFEPLYHLPDGWILREPDRFMVAADFAYAILIAVTFQELWQILGSREFARRHSSVLALNADGAPPLEFATISPWQRWWPRAGMLIGVLAVLAPAYPVIFGQMIPSGSKTNKNVTDAHVKFPAYWGSMASYLNNTAPAGAVLTLPPNPFYQVPYDWGYDGDDAFLSDLIKRRVIDPVSQNYYATSQQLLTSVDRLSADVLAHRWTTANRIAQAIGAKYILLRGDVTTKHPSILSVARLGAALKHDPSWHLVHRDGPLGLYAVPQPKRSAAAEVVTDSKSQPNLESLALFPAGSAIIKSKPRPDLPAIIETPPLTAWHLTSSVMTTTVKLPEGRKYLPVLVPSWSGSAHRASTATAPDIIQKVHGTSDKLSMSLGPKLIHDGDFSSGGWQRAAQDCWSPEKGQIVRGTLLAGAAPGGVNALRLTSRLGITCEYAPVKLTHGPLLITLKVKHVKGAPAQICLWYSPKKLCSAAPISMPVKKSGWRSYKYIIGAPTDATALRLEIYSAQANGGKVSVNDFADVMVHPLDRRDSPILISRAPHQRRVHLIQTPDTSGPQWTGPAGDERVVVDGMRNGWLGTGSVADVSYADAAKVRHSYLASVIGGLIVLALVIWELITRLRGPIKSRFRPSRDQPAAGD